MKWSKSEFVIWVRGAAITGEALALPVKAAVKQDAQTRIRISIPYG
jgi:hypothetical protein